MGTLASVPHKCDDPNGLHYSSCDRAGCGSNIFYEDAFAMGPGSDYTIDTTRAYTHSVAFETSSAGQLSGIKNTLLQDDNSFVFYTCDSADYLADMTSYLESNMVMIFSQWGSSRGAMSWLDGMTGC